MNETQGKLQELLDQYELQKITTLYSRAVDRQDMDLLRSLYHPDATDQHGMFTGTIDEYIEHIQETAQSMIYSMHNITHSTFDIRGDVAAGESYCLAHHLFTGGYEKIARFFGKTYADERVADGTIDQRQAYFCGVRYHDRFERRGGVWKIAHRQITNEWNFCQPDRTINDEGTLAKLNLPGERNRHDPAYLMLSSLDKSGANL